MQGFLTDVKGWSLLTVTIIITTIAKVSEEAGSSTSVFIRDVVAEPTIECSHVFMKRMKGKVQRLKARSGSDVQKI